MEKSLEYRDGNTERPKANLMQDRMQIIHPTRRHTNAQMTDSTTKVFISTKMRYYSHGSGKDSNFHFILNK